MLLWLEKLTRYQILQTEALTYSAHAELFPFLSAFAKPHKNSCISGFGQGTSCKMGRS